MRIGVACEKAVGVHPVGRWLMAGGIQRKGYLAREAATLPDEVQVYIDSKPLIG
jgi:hypothetical protein